MSKKNINLSKKNVLDPAKSSSPSENLDRPEVDENDELSIDMLLSKKRTPRGFGDKMDHLSIVEPKWGQVIDQVHSPVKPTTNKLEQILNKFQPFEDEMQNQTRYRKEKAEQEIHQVKIELNRLEKLLNQEVKKRVEMNKNLQSMSEEEIIKINENFDSILEERDIITHEKIDAIIVKMNQLDDHFDAEKERIYMEIDERDRELRRLLLEFKKCFDIEVEDRLKREATIKKNFDTHEVEVTTAFPREIAARETKYEELLKILQENISTREKSDAQFRVVVDNELKDLQRIQDEEVAAREKEDDEIVDALNRYTSKMKESLKIINSQDM